MEDFEYQSIDELATAIDKADGLLSMYMWTLRDAYGADRLGKHVRVNISRELHRLGLDHYPVELPGDQWAAIRIFRQGTPVARLVTAAITPNPENDALLRRASDGDAQKILDKVREIVEV